MYSRTVVSGAADMFHLRAILTCFTDIRHYHEDKRARSLPVEKGHRP